MRHWKLISVLIVFIMLVEITACAGLNKTNLETPVREGGQKTVTITPTNTQSPTPKPPDYLVSQCIDLDSGYSGLLPPVKTAADKLVLAEEQFPRLPYLLTPANGIKEPIVTDGYFAILLDVSPDHTKLAYELYSPETYEGYKIYVVDAKGKLIYSIPWKDDWFSLLGWLGNEHLLVTKTLKEGEWVSELVAINISNGAIQEFQSKYPDFYFEGYHLWPGNQVIYDSKFSLAVYPTGEPGAQTISLFDTRNNRVLATLFSGHIFNAGPRWSPDENFLVVAGQVEKPKKRLSGFNRELFLIDRNGIVTQLTHFTEYQMNINIGDTAWSPNGQKVAFWFSYDGDSYQQLAVFNFWDNSVTRYCVNGFALNVGNSPQPIWSPDSRVILVNNKDTSDSPQKTIWIDINRKIGGVMSSCTTIEGWLVVK